MKRIFALLILTASGLYAQGSTYQDLWVAFRYDDSRIIFYTERLLDPVSKQDTTAARPAPIAPFGGGGYLLPLTPERLGTFGPAGKTTSGNERITKERIPLNRNYTLWLGNTKDARSDGAATIEVRTEEYLEQWGADNPTVRIAVLARVKPADLAKFKAGSPYYLISRDRSVLLQAQTEFSTAFPTTANGRTLNYFGYLGYLRYQKYDKGWEVTLTGGAGTLRNNVAYAYGD